MAAITVDTHCARQSKGPLRMNCASWRYLIAFAPALLTLFPPGTAEGLRADGGVSGQPAANIRPPTGSARQAVLRHAFIHVSGGAVTSALANTKFSTRIDFLGMRLGVPGQFSSLSLHPSADANRPPGGDWRFTFADGAGGAWTKSIPTGPQGVIYRLQRKAQPRRHLLLGFSIAGSPAVRGDTLYLSPWTRGMARVEGWIPDRAKSFALGWKGKGSRGQGVHAFQMSVVYYPWPWHPESLRPLQPMPFLSLRVEWPHQGPLWPPDAIVISESFWPFPCFFHSGAGKKVLRALLASGCPANRAELDVRAAKELLQRLSPKESFLLQTVGAIPPDMAPASPEVRKAAMLWEQASYHEFLATQRGGPDAVCTRIAGKDVYALAFNGTRLWHEYFLAFTPSGRLWCVGHANGVKGIRSASDIAASAVNFSGLARVANTGGKAKHRSHNPAPTK